MKHLDKLWLVVKDLWEIGGRLARITILIFLIWPIAMILTSLFAPQAVIALVTLLPLIGLQAGTCCRRGTDARSFLLGSSDFE